MSKPTFHLGACITDGFLYLTLMRYEVNSTITCLTQIKADAARLATNEYITELPLDTAAEPTEAQLVAGLKECEPLGELIDWREGFGRNEMRQVWAAMQAAR